MRKFTQTTLNCILVFFGASAAVWAQPPDSLNTREWNEGFGAQEILVREFPASTAWMRLEDKRLDIDAAADRAMTIPTAQTRRAGDLSYTNVDVLGNELSYAWNDGFQTSLLIVLPSEQLGSRFQLATKHRIHHADGVTVSLMPSLGTHAEDQERALTDAGAGLAILADFYLGDTFVLGLGAHGWGTFWYRTERENLEGCASRGSYPACVSYDLDAITFPSGGHHVLGSVTAAWHFSDVWSLKGEFITGMAAGTVWGLDYHREDLDFDNRRERYEDGQWAWGVPYDVPFTAGAAIAYADAEWAWGLGLHTAAFEYGVPYVSLSLVW